MKLELAKSAMLCTSCGVGIEAGDYFAPGPTCFRCVQRPRKPAPELVIQLDAPTLFEDRPREIIETAKKTLGAPEMRFDGSTYTARFDQVRLAGQILKTFNCMSDQQWRTIDEIHDLTGVPHTSVSAQLRHLRKEKFGAHTVNRRPRGERSRGLFEYQLVPRSEARAA